MRLGIKDLRALGAFVDGRPAHGFKLSSDGHRLDGHWMGGHNLAEWKHDFIVFHDKGSRAAQTVQKKLKKMIPSALFGGFNPGHHHPRFWIKSALKYHKKGALHRQLGVPVGDKIPSGTLRHAAKRGGKVGRRARLALTLGKLRRRR